MTTADLNAADPQRLAQAIVEARGAGSAWLDELMEALDRRRAGGALGRFLEVWGLSQAQAARLFGVSRQALSKWLERGVPAERREAIADLAAATDLLVRYLKRDRIAAAVRRESAALDGRSLLDMIEAGRTREVLTACRAMFDFDRVQS